ncbi:hypothetical protein CANTEDRAFT_101353 [Yamadazyma tenuis ATCC 10573]|uniref:Mediator of RNA polymerase II transcription subunit 9 n=2 Tax=Candida tenuis TaxID=2315449 RepID=G3AY12_CANTC|nr:uncharacterized protein CANTEDRAFT_101353 [Yamadazyma tenuis ATCC 10573]EGV65747.1 hypothetical protein CANTEDRAFT_101353 [Yamadazyma tenuis ATCC 10573]
MSSPKEFNFTSPGQALQAIAKDGSPGSPNNLSRSQSRAQSQSPDIAMDIDIPVPEVKPDQLEKLHQQELIPELFGVLHDLQSGILSAKDFDNQVGGIRLKLANIKQYLRDFPGITESVDTRVERIETLRVNNESKLEVMKTFKEKVEAHFK